MPRHDHARHDDDEQYSRDPLARVKGKRYTRRSKTKKSHAKGGIADPVSKSFKQSEAEERERKRTPKYIKDKRDWERFDAR
jgi:hypothetical protein